MAEASEIEELSQKKQKYKAKCCISHCKNDQPPLFPFPKNAKIRRFWEEATGKYDVKTSYVKVCLKHFSPNDLVRDLKSELLGLTPKQKLKPEVIPHLNLSHLEVKEKSVTDTVPQIKTKSGRIVKRKVKNSPLVDGKYK